MKIYTPPFQITALILKLSEAIAHQLGLLEGWQLLAPQVQLRRSHQIKTIQASLAIEGNTLTVEQITALLSGKRVLGPSKDILEVKNAVQVYANLQSLNPLDIKDLLQAHAVLMQNLLANVGQFRKGNVGILKGDQVAHIAPPAIRVPNLMQDLFHFIERDLHTGWLIKACAFHYELEFIHPFEDGNGRMGRLWQQLLLMRYNPVFEFIPVEELIKANQFLYYEALGQSDRLGESTPFIEFSLEIILQAFKQYTQGAQFLKKDALSRLSYVQDYLRGQWFSRKDYILVHKDLSSATASRDLRSGIEQGQLLKKGDHNGTLYMFTEMEPPAIESC